MPSTPISVSVALLLKQEREDRYQKQNERELRLLCSTDSRRYSTRKREKQERGVVTVDYTVK